MPGRTPAKKTTAARKTPAKRTPAKRAPAKKAATAAKPAETPAVVSVPDGLHDRGRSLWSALGHQIGTPLGEVALEACRLADTLDELDRVVAGKGVLHLMSFRLDLDLELETGERKVDVTVKFQNVLTEKRQQQATFRALMAELGISAKKAGAAPSAPTGPKTEETPLEKARRLRLEREAGGAGSA